MKTITILKLLMDVLTKTVDAWYRFNTQDGDIDYFTDSEGSASEQFAGMLRTVKGDFEKLQEQLQTLHTAKQHCEDFSRDVSHYPVPNLMQHPILKAKVLTKLARTATGSVATKFLAELFAILEKWQNGKHF
jgi:hypothetical protein